MFAGLTVSQKPVSILIRTDLFQRWKRAVNLSRRAAVQGKYSCTVSGRAPNNFFHDSLSTFLPTACQVTVSEGTHKPVLAGLLNPCTERTGSGLRTQGQGGSPQGHPHLLSICPALMAQEWHMRSTLARRGKPGESVLVFPFCQKVKQLQPSRCTVKEASIYVTSQMAVFISIVR